MPLLSSDGDVGKDAFAPGDLRFLQMISAAANENGVARRDRFLRALDRRERLLQRAGIAVAPGRRDEELGGAERCGGANEQGDQEGGACVHMAMFYARRRVGSTLLFRLADERPITDDS